MHSPKVAKAQVKQSVPVHLVQTLDPLTTYPSLHYPVGQKESAVIPATLVVADPYLQLVGQVKQVSFPPVSPKQFPVEHVK